MRRPAIVAGLVISAALMMAQPAVAGSWQQQGVALPPNATSVLNGVSCTSPGTCMAVGSFHNPGDGTHLLAESRSGSTWTTVSIPDPGGAQLDAISCTSPTTCTAVGGSGTGTFAERWDGTQWTTQAPQNPPGATTSVLTGVSCTSPTACTAVGDSSSAPDTAATLAEKWDGTTWTIQPTPNVSGQAFSKLQGVSCKSAMCIAVGNSGTGASTQTLAEAWDGTTWTIQPTPNRPGGVSSDLNGVSCTTATACTAVGLGLAERWDGTTWSSQTIRTPRHGEEPTLDRVSCPALNSCTAVGTFFQDAITTLLAEHWNGTTWKVQQTPITSSQDSSLLNDVSCPGTLSCTAVGSYHDPTPTVSDQALAEVFALRWQLSILAEPGGISSGLSKVSCSAANACTAIGDVSFSDGTSEPVAEIWDGSTWTITSSPGPGTNLSGVSCTAKTACTAVGDVLSGGTPTTLAEFWDGTNWTAQSTPNPDGATRSFLTSVSCTTATACTAVGFYDDSQGNELPLAERWDGTSWTIQSTPNPPGSTSTQLMSVSCPSASSCVAVGTFLNPSFTVLTEVWDGTTWTIESTPMPRAFLSGVSCSAPNACTGVGDVFNGTQTVPLAERWDGTNWTVQGAANPSGATIAELADVSCPAASARNCTAVGFQTDANGVATTVAEHWNGSSWALQDTVNIPSAQTNDLTGVSCATTTGCMAAGFITIGNGNDDVLDEQFS